MMFGEPHQHPKFDPETLFMEGPHGREYMKNRLKVTIIFNIHNIELNWTQGGNLSI